MSDTPYSYGGYSVTVAADGAIRVRAGDQISHYCMAIYHDFNDMERRFGLKGAGGQVRSFLATPGADINRITVGQTVYDMKTFEGGGGNNPTPPGRQSALALIDQFERRGGPTAFTQFSRSDVATGLRDRVNDPKKIGQDRAGVCGPTAFLFNLAQDDPVAYARLVIDLYEYGVARTGRLVIRPTRGFVRYVPSAGVAPPADWIPEGSLRNSEDWGQLYPLLGEWGERYGPSSPWAIARWFKDAGYTQSEWGELAVHPLYLRQLRMERLGRMIGQGYRVVLLVSHQIEFETPSLPFRLLPTHYVGMTAPPVFTPAGDAHDFSDNLMSLTIFSHRQEYDVGVRWMYNVRPKPLTVAELMQFIWGYAAGRY